MLEQRDLEKMEGLLLESEARQDKKMETLLLESEARQDKKVETLLLESEARQDKKMETLIHESEARQDKKQEALEIALTGKMEDMRGFLLSEIEKSQDLVLNEIAVTQNYIERNMNKKLDNIIQRLDTIEQFYRCDKLDSETLSLVVKNMDQLTKRVEAR